jgi:thioredoxin 1
MKILKFGASWCGACKALDRELNKLKYIPIEYINVDDDKSESKVLQYTVKNLPTLLIVKEEKILYRFSGIITADKIQKIWEDLNATD